MSFYLYASNIHQLHIWCLGNNLRIKIEGRVHLRLLKLAPSLLFGFKPSPRKGHCCHLWHKLWFCCNFFEIMREGYLTLSHTPPPPSFRPEGGAFGYGTYCCILISILSNFSPLCILKLSPHPLRPARGRGSWTSDAGTHRVPGRHWAITSGGWAGGKPTTPILDPTKNLVW